MRQHVRRLRVAAVLAAAGAAAVFSFAAPVSAAMASNTTAVVSQTDQHSERSAGLREPGTCHTTTEGRWGRTMCTGLMGTAKISLYTKCSTGRTVKAVRRPRSSTLNLKISCSGGSAVRAWTTIKHRG
jgi:hypothetical protein